MHIPFYVFFKVGERCDEITVDHRLKVSQKPKIARIQVGGSRGPSCGKLSADNSFITKMAAEQLFHATGDMCRSTILHKNCSFIASLCFKSRNNKLF